MAEFRSGMQHLQDAIESGKRRSESFERGGAGSLLNYFSWKDGDRKIVRFLADDMITGDFYDFIVNKDGKTSNFMVDPDEPERLKRYMAATPGIGWRKPFQSNTLEQPKTTNRAVAVAVLRHEVPDPATGKLKVEDYLYDREIDGKMYPSRWFGIVQQGINNFWHTLAVSCFKRFGSIATMDYEITREGGGLDTKYSIIPLPEDPVLNTTEIVREFYFYGQPWDPNDEQRFLKCPKTTKEWAKDFSSDDRHKRLLVGTGLAPAATATPPPGGGLAQASAQADEAQAMASSGTTFSSLTETLLNKARES
jgi:hypothetical protein